MDTPMPSQAWSVFDTVRLRCHLSVEGEVVPEGATGSIVKLYPEDGASIVEFTAPRSAVVTVALKDLERDPR